MKILVVILAILLAACIVACAPDASVGMDRENTVTRVEPVASLQGNIAPILGAKC